MTTHEYLTTQIARCRLAEYRTRDNQRMTDLWHNKANYLIDKRDSMSLESLRKPATRGWSTPIEAIGAME